MVAKLRDVPIGARSSTWFISIHRFSQVPQAGMGWEDRALAPFSSMADEKPALSVRGSARRTMRTTNDTTLSVEAIRQTDEHASAHGADACGGVSVLAWVPRSRE